MLDSSLLGINGGFRSDSATGSDLPASSESEVLDSSGSDTLGTSGSDELDSSGCDTLGYSESDELGTKWRENYVWPYMGRPSLT